MRGRWPVFVLMGVKIGKRDDGFKVRSQRETSAFSRTQRSNGGQNASRDRGENQVLAASVAA